MAEVPEITVYTRPGCPFSAMLHADLRAANLPFRSIDIWQNPDAAAAVRAVANGNETVPTVNVGAKWLVNPSLDEVRSALEEAA
jgi:mycoredoxin